MSRFRGAIAGIGTTSGTRIVVGSWRESPLGAFADAMVETADGHRVLVAPRAEVAEFVGATYVFDEVRIEPVDLVEAGAGTGGPAGSWRVLSASLDLELRTGRRTALGLLLALVPRRLAESPAWCAVTDPVARVVLPGVRTRGTARGGRREYYGATGARRIVAAAGTFDGRPLGGLAPVSPPPAFGFSSTPRTPSLTEVVTTVVGD
ncbi:hypothetical protein [Nocardioides pantholopis]|uniref:hypothetical protein n=1 Tax=Nocardioides pantholopis TaxID=2483798 RepID=UPI000F087B65|nr:hypothetical protein [Nocardioides pantholopis]